MLRFDQRVAFASAPTVGGAPLLTQTTGDARYALAGSGGIVQAAADIRYVYVTGDTMTGPLGLTTGSTIGGEAILARPVADELYLTAAQGDVRFVNVDGDAMTGSLSIAGLPVAASPDANNILQWRSTGLYVEEPTTASTQHYRYSTNTAMADPGAGIFRLNADATQIAMDVLNGANVDITQVFGAVKSGDELYIQDENNAANWRRGHLTADPADQVGWFLLTVTPVDGAGAFPNNTPCTISFFLGGGGGGGGGGGITQADADLRYVNLTGDTMTGALTLTAPATLTAASRGHRLGDLGPTAYTAAMPDTDASIFLYRNSNVNWAGLGADGSGNAWWRVGAGGSPAPLLQLTASSPALRVGGALTVLATGQAATLTGTDTAFMGLVLNNLSGGSDYWQIAQMGSSAANAPARALLLYNSAGGGLFSIRSGDGRVGIGSIATAGAGGQLDVQAINGTIPSLRVIGNAAHASSALIAQVQSSAGSVLFGIRGDGWPVFGAVAATSVSGLVRAIACYNNAGAFIGYLPLYSGAA
jgi:hypothetical protein